MFGEYAFARVVYGSREGQKIEYVPLDEQLQLSQSEFSYLLRDWNQSLAVELPYKVGRRPTEQIVPFWGS